MAGVGCLSEEKGKRSGVQFLGRRPTHSPPVEIFDMKALAPHNPLADCVSDSISLFSLSAVIVARVF